MCTFSKPMDFLFFIAAHGNKWIIQFYAIALKQKSRTKSQKMNPLKVVPNYQIALIISASTISLEAQLKIDPYRCDSGVTITHLTPI